ncbi:MAG: hypothetical protein IJ735_00300 [Clostridia bacterium]|nr:hypothetical protein [Clostridia bacterium]
MKKSMYSLILMDDVVREIDMLAAQQNTNRSNMVNQILAEYVSLVTPEKRINNIFNYIENLLGTNTFVSFIEPHDRTMSVKSSLDFKYRPTIRYEVELYRTTEQTIGELKIIFRTQSSELLLRLKDFFNLWTKLEQIYLGNYFRNNPVTYSFDNGKFVRTFSIPSGKEYNTEEIAKAISDYIKVFDEIIKGFLSDKYQSVTEIENRYLQYLNECVII